MKIYIVRTNSIRIIYYYWYEIYNLEGTSEYEINLQQEYRTAKTSGKFNIVRERRKVPATPWSFSIQDSKAESYDINQISSKECKDILLVAEKELSEILSNLLKEKDSYEKKSTGFRRK